jgi:hypothetical protein
MEHKTREDWLQAAVADLRPMFDLLGRPLATNIRVSCGYPLNFKRNKRLGDCHASTESADRSMEIFIAPTVDKPIEVFTVLLSQLCRTTSGALSYGTSYSVIASAMGLEGSATGWKVITRSIDFPSTYHDMIMGLGAYPHAEMSISEVKTQNTRMLKAFCPVCDYTVRLSTKWALLGLPTCPLDSTTFTLAPTV